MAFPARFERAAFRLGGGRSIQLSYGNMMGVSARVGIMSRGGQDCQVRSASAGGTTTFAVVAMDRLCGILWGHSIKICKDNALDFIDRGRKVYGAFYRGIARHAAQIP